MADGVWIALIVAFTSVASPAVLAYLTGRQRAREKAADWARQDEVAAKVAEAAALLVESNAVTVSKLDEVHVMVNQQRTDAARYTALLVSVLRTAGIEVPADESLS